MFNKIGRWCHDRRWIVIGIWLAVLVVGGGVLQGIGTNTKTDFDLPDVESRRATEILLDEFGGAGAGMGGRLVFRTDGDIRDHQAEIEAVLSRIDAITPETAKDSVDVRVVSPFSPDGARQINADGTTAYAEIELPEDVTQANAVAVRDQIEEIRTAAALDDAGVDENLGGQIFADFEPPNSEILGLAFAMVILLLAFGSVMAMGMPIGVALFGIGAGTILAGFISHLVSPPDFAGVLGLMIGLGVGIDYALFIVTRFRENLHRGQDLRTATAVAIDTAGRAVIFAGTTVVISLLGMVIMGMSFVTGMAVNAATVVAATMVASITLLPALLSLAGPRIEVTRWRGLVAAGFIAVALVAVGLKAPPVAAVALVGALLTVLAAFALKPLRREVPRREPTPLRRTFAYRWSRAIQHHPWRSAIGGVVVLVVLAIPIFSLRLGFSDEGNYPAGTETRVAYDQLAEGFGPGFNGPLAIAAELPEGVTGRQLLAVTAALKADPGVVADAVSPPILAGVAPAEGGDDLTPEQAAAALDALLAGPDRPTAVLWQVTPETSPQDERTTELVHRLRDDVIPEATAGTDLEPAVGGFVAITVDFSDYLASRLPVFLAAVLGLSFILLMVVFRSILVPLKAVVMNLLSIGAAYGVVVAVFQWGWLKDVFGIETAPIEPFMPMMLFAIVFGLSMDYEVFLLSRVKEEWDRTGDSRESVADGLAATARVITAAAAIMVFVFGAFLLEDQRVIKLMGTGLATAILIDATIVRMLLVPATMELLGDLNWWLPRWLDRLLPNIDVEGHDVDAPAPDADAGDAGERGDAEPDEPEVPEPVGT